ncbi:MAG TPA: SMC-Scp complex subunit ScpB [Dehalococcoidia bacterium]|nr:SMC-Scp complex subunit ScpB [Dehalococcoidia bacterium]
MARIRRPVPDKVRATLESILFVAQEPVELAVLAHSLHLKVEEIETALDSLTEECRQRGVRIQRSGDLVQMATAPESARYVENFLNMDHHQRLSTAGLETLAIVAYRQPITRAGIEAVRGVNSDGAVATLLARDLIEEVGRAHTPGRPVLLGTTVRFLEHFGLERPGDLPPLPEEEDGQDGEASR